MPEIELLQPEYSPGEPVTGRLIISKTDKSEKMRGVTVRLVHSDSSTQSDECRFEVVDTVTIPGSYQESIDFSLDLPLLAEAGFQGKFGRAGWAVRASVDVPGIDLKPTEQPLAVLPMPTEPLTDLQAQEHAADLASRAKASAHKGRFGPGFVASVFIAVGLFVLARSIAAIVDDPTGREALYITIFGLVIGGFFTVAGLWAFTVMCPRRNKDVSIELRTASARMGEAVRATVVVAQPGLVAGLVGVERYASDNKLKKGHTVSYFGHVFHEDWRDLEPGTTDLSFVVPKESFATYGGTAVFIDWSVAVVPTDNRATHGLPASNLSRVVVVH